MKKIMTIAPITFVHDFKDFATNVYTSDMQTTADSFNECFKEITRSKSKAGVAAIIAVSSLALCGVGLFAAAKKIDELESKIDSLELKMDKDSNDDDKELIDDFD